MNKLLKFSSFSFLLLFLLAVSSCSRQTIIVHDRQEREANEILTYLNDHGIRAIKEQAAGAGGGGGNKEVLWNIKVDESRANEAMALLNAAGLPRRPVENLLGIFTNSSLVPSEMQELIRYQAGLAETISGIIRKFDGVIDAEVQLAFPKEDLLNPTAPKNAITASVYVKHNGVLDDPNSHLESKIRRLVANGVPNLSYDNVTVVGERSRLSDQTSELTSTSASNSERPMIYVWGLILAKESITRFRVVFFSFFVACLVLLACLTWLLFKLFPVVKKAGGWHKLFSFHPLEVSAEAKPAAEKPPAPDGKANAPAAAEPTPNVAEEELLDEEEEDDADEENPRS